jgi:hypothetical protein
VKLAMEGAKVLIFGRHEEELRDALHDLRVCLATAPVDDVLDLCLRARGGSSPAS